LSDTEYSGELAVKCRQLAERFYRPAAVAFDSTSSAGFTKWGDELMAQAKTLDQANGKPEGDTDKT
jgi:hypothetical protein